MLELMKEHYKTLISVPFLTMNCTLALIETIQRYYSFNKREEVGLVSELFLAPVRSTKMMPLDCWDILVTGLKHNKRIAVYKKDPVIARIASNMEPGCRLSLITSRFVGPNEEDLCLSLDGHPDLCISFSNMESKERIFGIRYKEVENDKREYLRIGDEADEWMSKILGIPVTVLHVPETKLSGEPNYPVYGSDSGPVPVPPVHIISISTLQELNEKSGKSVEMARLRPNIVVKNSESGAEGFWKVIRIGDQLELEQTFMNPRCGVINVLDGKMNTGVYDAIYRHGPFRDTRNRPCFGSYWKVLRPGKVHVGDKIVLLKSVEKNISAPPYMDESYVIG